MLRDVFREPLAVEAFFAVVLLFLLFLLVRSLKGVAARISRRRALAQFVAGVDLFFKGEYGEAREALARVLESDPENVEARILLGDACREMGDVAEAHKHHYQVAEVFGHDLPRNRLSLGRDLLRMGKAAEAIPHLRRALEYDVGNGSVRELLLEASLEAGRLAEAVDLARGVEEEARGADRERARRVRARVSATAGRRLLEEGRFREAAGLLRAALRLNPTLVAPRLDLVRAAYLGATARAAEKELAGQLREMARLAGEPGVVFEPPAPGAAGPGRGAAEAPEVAPKRLPGGAPAAALPAPGGDPGRLPARADGAAPPTARPSPGDQIPEARPSVDAGALVRVLLPREGRYVCARCGRAEIRFRETCPECGGFGTLAAADDTSLVPVADMEAVFDEIVENRAFVRSLVRRAARGDPEAADRLAAVGPRAVSGIFRELMRVEDNVPLVRVLTRLGPEAVPAILDAYRRARAFSTKRLVRERMGAFRSVERPVMMALAGMGDAVTPAMEELLESEERDLRRIGLGVLIRLGRADRIEELRFGLSTKEILDRLNDCPPEELDAFLDGCPPDGFLVDLVLTDRTFGAEEALARALARPANRGKLRKVLMARGFSSGAYEALEACWSEEGMQAVVSDIVRAWGKAAADHLLKTYTTRTLPDATREEALRLFLDLGAEEMERLVERLIEGDPETERAVMRIIRAFGNRAVPYLEGAYGKMGILQRVGLNRRRLLYRKMTLVRALGRIGTWDALQALRRLHDREGDADLKRRIAGVLARASGKGEGR